MRGGLLLLLHYLLCWGSLCEGEQPEVGGGGGRGRRQSTISDEFRPALD